MNTAAAATAVPVQGTVPALLTRPHLVDAAKPGMEALALWLASNGLSVTAGIDPADTDGAAVGRLRAAGIRVRAGFSARNVRADRTAVVWPGTLCGPHRETDRAQESGLPVLHRAQALSALCAGSGRQVVAVAGSHSATTAAGVLAAVLDDGHTGRILNAPLQGSTCGRGGERRLVVDLSPDTGLHEAPLPAAWSNYFPTHQLAPGRAAPAVGLVTAAATAVPHFADPLEALDAATSFARRCQTVVLPLWAPGMNIVHERLTDRPGPTMITVGLTEDADVWVIKPAWTGSGYLTTVRHDGVLYRLELPVTGYRHALGACAAVATALVAGEGPEAVAARLADVRDVEGSLALTGTAGRIDVRTSRARHPQEVADDIAAARMLTEGRVIAVLEPDGHARTRAHAAEFATALAQADRAVLLPAATARRVPDDPGPLDTLTRATAQHLAPEHVHRLHLGKDAVPQITAQAEPGDLVLLIGTGPATRRLATGLLTALAPAATPDTSDLP